MTTGLTGCFQSRQDERGTNPTYCIDGVYHLHYIFIDRYMVEVFANERQAVLETYPGFAEKRGLCAVSTGGSAALEDLRI